MKGIGTKAIKIGVMMVTAVLMLTGCRFGFASDPDDPNEVVQEEPIDTSVDTFEYDASLSGTKITLLNSKAEIQVALTKMAEEYEKKSGVHVEVMPVTDGDSPYTKVVSMYNSGTPPTMAILDTTDVIALAEEKAVDLTGEPWTAEAEGYLTEVNGKIYSFPLCIEGRGLIYNRSVIEETLGREFDPLSVTTMDEFAALPRTTRDVLVSVIVPKNAKGVVYLSQRNQSTDFPVLTCAVANRSGRYVAVIGASPYMAEPVWDEEGILDGIADAKTDGNAALTDNSETNAKIDKFAEYVAEHIRFGSNIRAGAEYREIICRVLTRRAVTQSLDICDDIKHEH